MKSISIIISIVLTSFHIARGQSEAYLEAGQSQQGNLIYYHGPLPLPAGTEIVRIESSGKETAFALKMPTTLKDLQRNASEMPKVFDYLLSLRPESATKLFDMLGTTNHTQKLQAYPLPTVAFACGLALHDDKAPVGSTYQLRIGGSRMGESVNPTKANPGWENKRATALGQGDHSKNIRLGWLVPKGAKEKMLGVVVYRSKPFADKFEPVQMLRGFQTQSDSLIATARDTTTRVLGSWHYAIRMIDRYGAASAASELIMAHNYPHESQPMFTSFKAIGRKDKPAVDLTWQLDNAFRARTINIYRSRSFDGPYTRIATVSPTTSTYTDSVDELMEAYFYQLEAEDLAEENTFKSARHPAVSEFRPAAMPATDLAIDSIGRDLRLSWRGTPPLDRGYYVTRTEGYDEKSLKIISPFIPAKADQSNYEYLDRDTTLRGDRFYTYSIITESHGYLQAPASEFVSLRPNRPTYTPTPNRCHIRPDDTGSGALLTWEHVALRSDYTNHLGYRVYARKKESTEGYKDILGRTLLLDTNYYHLTHADPALEYAVRAENIFNALSAFSPPTRINDTFINDFGPRYLRSEPISETQIELRWVRPSDPRAAAYHLYMTDGKTEPMVIAKLKPEELKYNVPVPPRGTARYYFIIALDASGKMSSPSEWVTVMP